MTLKEHIISIENCLMNDEYVDSNEVALVVLYQLVQKLVNIDETLQELLTRSVENGREERTS